MVIYMDEYRKTRAQTRAKVMQHQYRDEERLCVNWSPVVAAIATFGCAHPHEASPALPDDLAALDVEAFLDHVHTLATQI